MIDFKAGQKVWWNDPEGYSSGEYEVLEDCFADEYHSDLDFDDRIVLIGDGYSEAEVYAQELNIM